MILHWLGDMFDPLLAGYWGARDLDAAADVVLDIIAAERRQGRRHQDLAARRRHARSRCARGCPRACACTPATTSTTRELIRGDGEGSATRCSGIFDAIAPAAAAALHALDDGDLDRYEEMLAPTVPLSRHIFAAPTPTTRPASSSSPTSTAISSTSGWSAGWRAARSVLHLAELFVLADQAGLLRDPELASERMRRVLALAGVGVSRGSRASTR